MGVLVFGFVAGVLAGITVALLGAAVWLALGAYVFFGSVTVGIWAVVSVTKSKRRAARRQSETKIVEGVRAWTA